MQLGYAWLAILMQLRRSVAGGTWSLRASAGMHEAGRHHGRDFKPPS